MRLTVLLVIVVSLMSAAGGCTLFKPQRSLTIAVRDQASQEPIVGAFVHARPTHFYVASSYDLRQPILDPVPRGGTRARTGPNGTARLDVLVDHPIELIVVAPGYVPARLAVEDTIAFPSGQWIEPEAATPQMLGEVRLEIRLDWDADGSADGAGDAAQ